MKSFGSVRDSSTWAHRVGEPGTSLALSLMASPLVPGSYSTLGRNHWGPFDPERWEHSYMAAVQHTRQLYVV